MSDTPILSIDPNTLTIITAQIGPSTSTRINQNFSDPALPYDPTKTSVVSYENAIGSIDASLQSLFSPYGEAIGDTFGDRINGLIGTDFVDWLGGNVNANYLNGGAGNDTLWGMGGADTLEGGDGFDTASYSYYDSVSKTYFGEAVTVNLGGLYGIANSGDAAGDVFHSIEGVIGSHKDDMLIGNAGDNVLEGGLGSDTLVGGIGSDKFYGSFKTDQTDTGIDVVSYQYAGSAIAFDMSYSITSVGEAAGDTFASIEKVIGSNFNDTMGGTMYAEIFDGGEGDDVLAGHGGADKLLGGNGHDLASYTRSTAAVQVNLDLAPDEIQSGGDAQGDRLMSIEGVIGSKYGDILTGNLYNNTFDGWLGADTMTGGLGSDTYHVNEAGDQVIETTPNDGIDLVITEIGYALGANVENLTAKAGSSAAASLTGNALNNVITGNEFGNVINGGFGADTMIGGAGNDTYYVDNAGDVVIDTSGFDTIITSVGYVANGVVEKVVAIGADAISLTGDAGSNGIEGNAGANTIVGGLGNDSIYGGAGNDKLYGGLGRDFMRGDAGRDIFVFNTKASKANTDRVSGFSVKDDSIWLDNKYFKKLGKGSESKPGKLNKKFFSLDKAKDKNDYLIYNKKTGVLSYDADGSGSKKAVEIAKLDKKLKMTYKDFFII